MPEPKTIDDLYEENQKLGHRINYLNDENNFYRSGAEGWTSIYFDMNGAKKSNPLSAPWDLSAPDPSTLRTEEDQAAIFAAYEELVAYAATNLTVVTKALV